jgi:hypothetical protein
MQSLKQLHGNQLGASDGDIGHIKDFYFDDRTWAVRYVVADTGGWLSSRQVLIAPHAFGGVHPAGKSLRVNLTRKQIEDSPEINTHKPVSRQFEEEYYRYYGWPYYWEGDGLWGGMRSFPILELPPNFISPAPPAATGPKAERADARLHSSQAVSGYHFKATDGIAGYVSDFLMDPKTWAIQKLVVKTGHRFSGKEVVVACSSVYRISFEDSTVFVMMTKEAVENSPEYHAAPKKAVIPTESILAL